MLSTKVLMDLKKLATCPGLHVALGWILASHDYEANLYLEGVLREQDKHQKEPDRFSPQHRSYFTRLRTAHTREAIGLCNKTEEFPNLVEFIRSDHYGAPEAYDRLRKLSIEGPKSNGDMKLVWDIRNSTFHYCLDEFAEGYLKTIDTMLDRGDKFIEISAERTFPDRFEVADQLFQGLFMTQILGVKIENSTGPSKRFGEMAEVLVQIGDDISIVARAISQGLVEKYAIASSS